MAAMPSKRCVARLALVAGVACVHSAVGSTCTPTIDGVQYDLSQLQRPVDAPYNIRDAFDANTNFTFNVCNDVDAAVLPDGPNYIPERTSVPAYQYQVNYNTIYQLSRPAEQGWNFTLLGKCRRGMCGGGSCTLQDVVRNVQCTCFPPPLATLHAEAVATLRPLSPRFHIQGPGGCAAVLRGCQQLLH